MATGKGFSRTSDTAEIRNYTSWGRTRSPKNILSNHRAGIDAAGATHGSITDTNFSDVCTTENQRYLHITHEAADAGTLEVWGYMHASGQWGQIGANITTAASLIHTVVEIAGVDQIKIKANTQTITKLWLACSTF
jgi:hypothetical protein